MSIVPWVIQWVLIAYLFSVVYIVMCVWSFSGDSDGKESACKVGDLDSIPELGRSPGEGNSYPLQYSDLENSMDYTVHGVSKSWT